MNEERLLILKMVEEGRITAQEAVELFEAMESDEPEKHHKREDAWRKLEKQGEDFAHKVEHAAERFSRSLETKLESGLAEQLANIPKLLSKIPFVSNMTDEVHEFVNEYSGTFAEALNEIPIELVTTNGAITVEGWDQDHFKLVVTQRIRAKEREIALKKVVSLNIPEENELIDRLSVKVEEQKDVSVSYHLSLPRKRPYLVTVSSTNGKCKVANLLAKTISNNTINGSITVRQSKAERIDATTSNGSSVLDYIESEAIYQTTANGSIKFIGSAKDIECRSINGSVKVMPLTFAFDQSKIQLTTTNGSVRCMLPRLPELNVKLDASSSIGRVRVDLANFAGQFDDKSGGRHIVRGEVISEAEDAKSIEITAKVSSGSIFVGQERKQDASE